MKLCTLNLVLSSCSKGYCEAGTEENKWEIRSPQSCKRTEGVWVQSSEECVSKLLIHSGLQTQADVLTPLTAITLTHGHNPPQHTHAHTHTRQFAHISRQNCLFFTFALCLTSSTCSQPYIHMTTRLRVAPAHMRVISSENSTQASDYVCVCMCVCECVRSHSFSRLGPQRKSK